MGLCFSKSNAPRKQQEQPKIYVALFDYEARYDKDLTFQKRDEMKIINNQGIEWWRAKHIATGRTGLIPRNYVTERGQLDAEDWFFGKFSRRQAECVILEKPPGTFLIRISDEKSKHLYSLTVKDYISNNRSETVKHFQIFKNRRKFLYIRDNEQFATLKELVQYYENSARLCNARLIPCPKTPPTLWVLNPELRDLEVNRNDIRLVKQLNQGFFGEVFLANWQGYHVAVKIMKPGTMSIEAFLREAEIMKKFRHDRLVALFAVCSKNEPIYIVQELMCKGSLLDYLWGLKIYLSLEILIYIASQIASGMAFLESQYLVHSDLAARNVLVGPNHCVKISDFGLARILTDINDINDINQGRIKLAVRWSAPEIIRIGAVYSTKSDVWSFGVVLMEIFTYGERPYNNLRDDEIIRKITTGYRLPKPWKYGMPDDIYNLILKCWKNEPNDRPTFHHIFDYLDTYNISREIPYCPL